MKKRFAIKLFTFAVLLAPYVANAQYSDKLFQSEVKEGLDIISAKFEVESGIESAVGEMGMEVYENLNDATDSNVRLFIPTTMYIRAGGGLNLGFITDSARIGNDKYQSSGSYVTQFGLGWNLTSFARTELDIQNTVFKFHNLKDANATYTMLGATLYFDLAHRYVQTGDVTRRRHFVPFIGLGIGAGAYEFQGRSGADGFVIGAPRAMLGFNVMLNDLIGIDVAYQYQMFIGNGFGWDTRRGGVDNISNIMASIRANF